MKKSKLKYVPGFYKIYDELIVNILDHMKRIEMSKSKNPVKTIKVNIELGSYISLFSYTNPKNEIQ